MGLLTLQAKRGPPNRKGTKNQVYSEAFYYKFGWVGGGANTIRGTADVLRMTVKKHGKMACLDVATHPFRKSTVQWRMQESANS